MQQIIPRILAADGYAAAQYYQGVFGGEITELFHAADGEGCAHAALAIREAVMLYFADAQDIGAQGIRLCLALHDPNETRELFDALSDGGTVIAPLASTDWAALTGSVRDRYGVEWEFNCGDGVDVVYRKG
ncbi:MAG: VOC family protein [Christensenellales bacterium]|jgi:uncharacterized glyoxalase superfamily protein PhnB